MSKGDELWEKREKLLRHLYDQGAIGPDMAARSGGVGQGIGADEMEMRALVSSLRDEELVMGRATAPAKLYLTGRGFAEARRLVEIGRTPML